MKKLGLNAHQIAVAQGLFVAFIWSTSWVFIKIGLEDIPALTFAGLRYSLGFLFLFLWFLRSGERRKLRSLSRLNWVKLAMLGILQYTLTQGGVFLSLTLLPTATVNLVISMTTIFVAIIGISVLREVPSWMQWLGIAVAVAGSLLYFSPLQVLPGQEFGYVLTLIALVAVTAGTLLGRDINGRGNLSPLLVTVVSMGFGGLAMLVVGLVAQGFPPVALKGWLIIFWLALANTAFAFTLFNLTLRTLTAAESNMISNTMIIQIPILAWIFLGERISLREIIGLVIVAVGLVLVQLGHKPLPEVEVR